MDTPVSRDARLPTPSSRDANAICVRLDRILDILAAAPRKPRKVGVRPVKKKIAGGDLKARERAFKARTGKR